MIEVKKLLELKLEPSGYKILELIYLKDWTTLTVIVLNGWLDWQTIDGVPYLKHLEAQGWLKVAFDDQFDWKQVHLRQKALDLFLEGTDLDKKFVELYSTFPMKVPDGKGGYRILRAKNTETHNGKLCREKWHRIVKGKPELPDLILKGLNKQLDAQRGNLQYMNELEFWLNKRVWEKYIDIAEDVSKETDSI